MNMETRRRLIKEVLDSDKNINKRVSNIQRQKLLGVTEDVAPYIQINQEDINKMKIYASTLRQVLEKRYLLTNNFLSDDSLPNVNKYIVELAQTEDVILAYNNVVSIYLNPRNTPETKSYIRRLLIAFEEIVKSIGINIFEIIGRIKISRKQDHINLMLYALTLYKIIGEQMNTGIFHIITNTDMKHEFNINMKLYNSSKLEALPVQTHFTMSEGGDSVSYDDLPPLEDPDYVAESYPQPECFTRPPYEYGPSERDIEDSRARVSRLGKPFEMTPSRSTHGMANLIQTPKRVKSGDEPPSHSSSADLVGEPGGELDGEPEEELPTHVDEPTSSSDFVYLTPSKNNYKGSTRSYRSFQ